MEMYVKRFSELTVDELYEILRDRSQVFMVEQGCAYQDLDGKDERSIHIFIKEDNQIKEDKRIKENQINKENQLKEDNRILAYLRVIIPEEGRDTVSIGRVLTIKEARGHGLARKLMQKGIEVAKSLAPTIEIEAQAYLKEFYESLGFIACSDVFQYEGRPHISMILD